MYVFWGVLCVCGGLCGVYFFVLGWVGRGCTPVGGGKGGVGQVCQVVVGGRWCVCGVCKCGVWVYRVVCMYLGVCWVVW